MSISESAVRGFAGAAAGSRRVLAEILNATREGALVVDRDMRISAWNAAADEAFGSGDRLQSNPRLSEVLRNVDLHDAFRRAIESSTSSDVRLERTTADKKIFDVHIAPIRLDGAGHAIGFFYDVTQIERLESIRQEFLSNISHELRTPLTSIMAFVETLEDGAIDDEENNRRFLGVIRRNAARMHSLIADILELSMIESGYVAVEIREVKLFDLVGDVLTNLSTKASEREIALKNEVEAGKIVLADSVRLEQMLTNLADNAIKFNRHGGTVTIKATKNADIDVISVTDTGEGILPEHARRIFERFYRADRDRSRDVGGTGLGLAIVKHLAKLHGGEVSVHSALSSGTTFQIELPSDPSLLRPDY